MPPSERCGASPRACWYYYGNYDDGSGGRGQSPGAPGFYGGQQQQQGRTRSRSPPNEDRLLLFAKTLGKEIAGCKSEETDLLHDPAGGDSLKFVGAKRAVSWQKETDRHRKDGGE